MIRRNGSAEEDKLKLGHVICHRAQLSEVLAFSVDWCVYEEERKGKQEEEDRRHTKLSVVAIYLEHMMILKPLKPRKKTRRLLKVAVHIFSNDKALCWICSAFRVCGEVFSLQFTGMWLRFTLQPLNRSANGFSQFLRDASVFAFMREGSILLWIRHLLFWSSHD